jgi:hypothetical protein
MPFKQLLSFAHDYPLFTPSFNVNEQTMTTFYRTHTKKAKAFLLFFLIRINALIQQPTTPTRSIGTIVIQLSLATHQASYSADGAYVDTTRLERKKKKAEKIPKHKKKRKLIICMIKQSPSNKKN